MNSVHIHDTGVNVWVEGGKHDIFTRGKEGDWESYRAVRDLLKANGYVFHDDPRLTYKSLKSTHHAGSRKNVHFTSQIYPAGFRFEFYEDVPRDNPNGGRYGFQKLARAPYLWRLAVTLIMRKIVVLLGERGFKDNTKPSHQTALEVVQARRDENMKSHPYLFKEPPQSYNATDEDGVLLQGGETRYFRTPNGHLLRGVVWRALNNVWDLVLNETEVAYEATFRLFTYDPKKHVRKESVDSLVKISRALERAVARRDYRRAERIQGAINRMTKIYDFKVGDKVFVDNPRYQGLGVVEYVRPPFHVGVKVGEKGDGNLWRYEWATVKPAAHEEAVT